MGEHLSKNMENLGREGISSLKEVGDELSSNPAHFSKMAKEIAADSLDKVKDQVDEIYQQGQKKVKKVGAKFKNEVRTHPLRSLLIASGLVVGIGLMVGILKRNR